MFIKGMNQYQFIDLRVIKLTTIVLAIYAQKTFRGNKCFPTKNTRMVQISRFRWLFLRNSALASNFPRISRLSLI